jgi:hypothetical protein
MVDMKVLVFSNFSKKQFEKIEISKLHEEWKISPFQVYRQASKNGGAIHPFSQNAKHIPKLPHNIKKNKK